MKVAERLRGFLDRHSDAMYWLRAVLIFALVRVWYRSQGVSFWFDSIFYFFQLLDPLLLRDRLAESLYYLHAQPPLWNLLTGLVLKAAPGSFPEVLDWTWMTAGLAQMLVLTATLRRLGLGPSLALGIATVLAASPQFVTYELYFMYPHLVGLLLAVSAWAFLRSQGRPGRWMAGGFAGLAALSLLRSVYHPAWLLGLVALAVALAGRGARRGVLKSAAIPVALVLLWCAKNAIVFGFFGTSSWGGNSLHRVARAGVDDAQVSALVRQGVLSPASEVYEFAAPEVFIDRLHLPPSSTGVPALDQERKETLTTATLRNPGNRNHASYLLVSPILARDALTLIRLHPEAWLRTVRENVSLFLRPVADSQWAAENRNRVHMVALKAEAVETSPVTWILLGLSFAAAAVGLVSGRVRREERLFLGVLLATAGWSTALALLAETGENNRFRYETFVPMLLVTAFIGREVARLVVRPAAPGSGGRTSSRSG